MNSQQLKKTGLPDKSGVYFFKKGKDILYIGKATSLRSRVRSYFGKDLIVTRGPHILDMVTLATSVEHEVTESVLESMILEANLIKKYQPKYNTKEKDNKSFNYVCITKDTLPRVLIIRGRGLDKKLYNKVYGPFPNGQQLREAMNIIRRIFPYIDNDSAKKNNVEFYKQLGLVPTVTPVRSTFGKVQGGGEKAVPDHFKKNFSAALIEYKNNIKNLKLFLEGKKKSVIINLKKEMRDYAACLEFEKAGVIKRRLFAIDHINDVALIKSDLDTDLSRTSTFRIEAYDIAHLGGQNMVGVMTVIENSEVAKNQYRKFIVRSQDKANDTGSLEEVLSRRLRHVEWGLPDLIVVDGSTAQVNVVNRVLNRYQFKIPIVAVVKDATHRAKALMGDETIIKKYKKLILLSNNEAHRFAITFHKLKRNKSFLS